MTDEVEIKRVAALLQTAIVAQSDSMWVLERTEAPRQFLTLDGEIDLHAIARVIIEDRERR